jgi:hypothetical protein
MRFKLLDTVVLVRNLPRHGLRKGDCGTVVELYPGKRRPRALEVEFVTRGGRTVALLTLPVEAVRPPGGTDLPSVRRVTRRSA